MYGLPNDLDLSFLVGVTLLQVCVGANEVILHFDGEVSITIESRFRVRGTNGHDAVFEDKPSSAASLAELLSDSIVDCLGHQDGTLRLSFAKGGLLEVYDSLEHYESYQIQHGQDIHVV